MKSGVGANDWLVVGEDPFLMGRGPAVASTTSQSDSITTSEEENYRNLEEDTFSSLQSSNHSTSDTSIQTPFQYAPFGINSADLMGNMAEHKNNPALSNTIHNKFLERINSSSNSELNFGNGCESKTEPAYSEKYNSMPRNSEFSAALFLEESCVSNINHSFNDDEIFGSDDDNSVDVGFLECVDYIPSNTVLEAIYDNSNNIITSTNHIEIHHRLGELGYDNDSEEDNYVNQLSTELESESLPKSTQETPQMLSQDKYATKFSINASDSEPLKIAIDGVLRLDASELESDLTPQSGTPLTLGNISFTPRKESMEEMSFCHLPSPPVQNITEHRDLSENVTEIDCGYEHETSTSILVTSEEDAPHHSNISDTTPKSQVQKDESEPNNDVNIEDNHIDQTQKINTIIQSPAQSRKRTWQTAFSIHEPVSRFQSRVGDSYQATIPTLQKRQRVSLESTTQRIFEQQIRDTSEEKYMKSEPEFQPSRISKDNLKLYINEIRLFLSEQQDVPDGKRARLPQDTYKILAQAQYQTEEALKVFKCKYNSNYRTGLTEREQQLFSRLAQRFTKRCKQQSPCIQNIYDSGAFDCKMSDLVNHYFQNAYISDNEDSESDEDECEYKRTFQVSSKCPAPLDEDEDEFLGCQLRRPQ